MDDRELLERAASAAKIRGADGIDKNGTHWWYNSSMDGTGRTWNPLENDGDAFRLMVDCNLTACTDGEKTVSASEAWSPRGAFITQSVKGCKRAATRRAIVRAAADMEAAP